MEWDKIVAVIPAVVKDLEAEYPQIHPMIRDDIFSILEKCCVVVYYPLENETNRGFHTKRSINGERKDFVYINTAKPLADQVFTAAHELGHVWCVPNKVQEKINEEIFLCSKDEEDIIDRFAAELLMPKDLFVRTFAIHMQELNLNKGKLRLEDFVRVMVMQMNDYMVPYESVRRRLVEIGLVTENVGKLLIREEKLIRHLVIEISKDMNTVLDNVTMKKTIPGLRGILDKIEKEDLLDEYTICKIKQDFDIDSIEGTDTMIIDIGDKVDGEN